MQGFDAHALGAPQARQWIRNTLSVVHFNVLCQIYEEQNLHLPANQRDEVLFANRKSKIAKELRKYDADVVTLNEAQPIDFYRSEFGDDYDILFTSKSENKPFLSKEEMLQNWKNDDDGQAILLRKRTVQLVKAFHIRCLTPKAKKQQQEQQMQQGATQRPWTSSLMLDCYNRDSEALARQHCTMALCFHVPSQRYFFVAAMHMKANSFTKGRDIPADYTRLQHLEQIVQQMHDIRAATANAPPIVFAGDFNAAWWCPTIKYLVEGRALLRRHEQGNCYKETTTEDGNQQQQISGDGKGEEEKDGAEWFHQPFFRFESAIATLNAGNDPRFTILDSTHEEGGWYSVLDYIMYTKEQRGGGGGGMIVPVGMISLPQRELWGTDAVLHCGSDHVPIGAEFLLL